MVSIGTSRSRRAVTKPRRRPPDSGPTAPAVAAEGDRYLRIDRPHRRPEARPAEIPPETRPGQAAPQEATPRGATPQGGYPQGGDPQGANLFVRHAEDLIGRLQAWAEELQNQQNALSDRQSRIDLRERQFRFRKARWFAELAMRRLDTRRQLEELARVREQLRQRSQELAFALAAADAGLEVSGGAGPACGSGPSGLGFETGLGRQASSRPEASSGPESRMPSA